MKVSQLSALVFLALASSCGERSATPIPTSNMMSTSPHVVQRGGNPTDWETFALPVAGSAPAGITGDIPGQIWFTEGTGNSVDQLRIGSDEIKRFRLPISKSFPEGISGGSDGNIWFCEQVGRIGRITIQGVLTEFALGPGRIPEEITAGSDGNLWFTDPATASIGRITQIGAVDEFPTPSGSAPLDITLGNDGEIWFSEDAPRVGKVTTGGVVSEYETPTKVPSTGGITAGADGNVWFSESPGHRLARVTPSGQVTEYYISERNPESLIRGGSGKDLFVLLEFKGLAEYSINSHHLVVEGFPPGQSSVGSLARGSDGNIWLTQPDDNDVAVFIRHILTVSPTSLSLRVGQGGTLTASEVGASSPLQAKSSDTSIATVIANGNNEFTVKGVGRGACNITISDHKKNNFPVPVTVN